MRARIQYIFFIFSFFIFSSVSIAESVFLGPIDDTSTRTLLENNQKQIEQAGYNNSLSRVAYKLSKISKKIEEKKEVIRLHKLGKTSIFDPEEIAKVNKSIKEEQNVLEQLNRAFLKLSVGSSDLSEFDDNRIKEPVEVGLQEVLEPLTKKLMKFTEKPRKIEKLLSDISSVEERIELLTNTISRLKSFKSLSSKVQLKVNSQIEYYRQKELLLFHQLDILESQLEKVQHAKQKSLGDFTNTVKDFIKVHGVTVVYALLIFLGIYILLSLLKQVIALFFTNKKLSQNQIFTKRLLNILLTLMSIVVATGGALAIIYSRSDWLIFAIALFIIFLLLWSLKNYLPKLVNEFRFMLNIGMVREGEIVQLEGISYQVKKIGFFVILENPLLSNSTIRLPHSKLETLHSREAFQKEVLFPTEVGDYIFMEDLYAKIIFQSPSIVTVQKIGGSRITFKSSEFVGLKSENISRDGFAISITISFGYKHQQIITTSILSNINRVIKKAVAQEDFYRYLKNIKVEFKEAKIESLDLVLSSFWDAKAANIYNEINRTIRRILVDMANSNGWTLPYPQLEVTNLKIPSVDSKDTTQSTLLLSK